MALQDRFDDVTPVAAGTPGPVWRALRRDVGDAVAVTQLDREVAEQAPRVAVRLAQVDDLNIVRVLDVVNDEGRTLMVEQWVDGATLDRVIGEGYDISAQQAITTVLGVLDGLAVAHHNGVAHGDLRPEVVLVDPSTGTPRLLGFGLGRPVPGAAARGTPATMSPEVVHGRPADPRSDVYSAGCLLFWLLTGRAPFPRDDPLAVLEAQVRNPMPWLPGAPSDVRQVVRCAMAKDPAARYGSATEMADVLQEAAARRYGEGWDDLSVLAHRAAGLVAELGPQAARSQLPPEAMFDALRPPPARRPDGPAPTPRPSAPVPLAATPLEDPNALRWPEPVPVPSPEPERRGRPARPVALDEATVVPRRRRWPAALALLILLAAGGAGAALYVRHQHGAPAAGTGPEVSASPSASAVLSAEPSPTASPSAPAAAADVQGTWAVTSTVTSVTGSIDGPDGQPLRTGAHEQRTYQITQRCAGSGTCTLTVRVLETGSVLTLRGSGATFAGSVTTTVTCGSGQPQAVTATLSIAVRSANGAKATSFVGTTKQVYAETAACPGASSTSTLTGHRA